MVLKNKKKKPVKETTIDDLAIMIGKGFDHVDKRFDHVDKRFEEMDKRFEEMSGKIESLRMDNVREHEEIKLKLGEVAYRFELVELQKRVEILERRINTKFLES